MIFIYSCFLIPAIYNTLGEERGTSFSSEWTVAAVVLAVAPRVDVLWSSSWSVEPLLLLPPVGRRAALLIGRRACKVTRVLALTIPVMVALVGLLLRLRLRLWLGITIVRVAVLCGCVRSVAEVVVAFICSHLLLLPHLIRYGSYRCWLRYGYGSYRCWLRHHRGRYCGSCHTLSSQLLCYGNRFSL